MKCLLCEPKQKILSLSTSSTANLRKHINTCHSSILSKESKSDDGDECTSNSESSSKPNANKAPSKATFFKQPMLSFSFRLASGITQPNLNSLIFNFIIKTMQPLRIVEEPSFIELVKGTHNPQLHVLVRPTLTAMLEDRFKEMQNV